MWRRCIVARGTPLVAAPAIRPYSPRMQRMSIKTIAITLALALAATSLFAQTDSVKKDTASLPSVTIIARRNITTTIREGFADRRKLGLGTFFDSTDVRKFDGPGLAALLRGVPGLRMMEYRDVSGGSYSPELRAASSIYQGLDGGACWSTVIYDNVAIYRAQRAGRPPNLRLDFNITGLEAVEFYRGPTQAPLTVSSSADCGLLVLWSRKRR